LIEVKTGNAKHTESQRKLMERGCPLVTLRSVEDAVELR